MNPNLFNDDRKYKLQEVTPLISADSSMKLYLEIYNAIDEDSLSDTETLINDSEEYQKAILEIRPNKLIKIEELEEDLA